MSDLHLFDDEVLQHGVFRTTLQALSRPGTVQSLPEPAHGEPLLAVLAALLDVEVGFTVAGADAQLSERITRATGSLSVPAESTAFLVAPDGGSAGLLPQLPRGVPDYPDRGAMVVYRVAALRAEGGARSWSGPGIKSSCSPHIEGLGGGELESLQKINRDFPLGVDALFVDRGGRVMGLPRTTRIGG